jgi:tetratricopeptide (TPR) repeat protein
VYYYARRYQESVRQYREALELDPNDVAAHQALGDAYERQDLKRQALLEWRNALVLAGDRVTAAALDRAYASGGFAAAVQALARSNLQHFGELTRSDKFVPAVEYARAYSRLGQKEQALRWLAKSCDEHTTFTLFLDVDPFYDNLRAEARFQEIVKRIHVPN